MSVITVQTLRGALPRAPQPWLAACVELMPTAGIDTPHEVASFLAQCAHESNEFTHLEENLNYSAARLAQVWKRFATNPDAPLEDRQPNALALRLEHNPEELANYIYADENRGPKSKLGNIQPGDGWRFHGRGPIQLTGRSNYTACGEDIGEDLVARPELLLTPYTGIRSALWFWRPLDDVDDDEDVRIETRSINGGETGLQHRQKLFNHILRHLEAA